MSHSYANLLCHIVYSTKHRKPFIDEELKTDLLPYLGGIVRELDSKALLINSMPDHVHMLVSLSPKHSVSDAIRTMKTNSSRWIHQKWPRRDKFGWQTGYGAFSVSASGRAEVERYIANQEEHHRTMTFQEEFILLLKKHGIDFDERYLWD